MLSATQTFNHCRKTQEIKESKAAWLYFSVYQNWCPGPESNRHGISTEGF